MDYNEAIETTVSRAQALAELAKHDSNIFEFFDDVGDKPEYTGKEVLDWLGY